MSDTLVVLGFIVLVLLIAVLVVWGGGALMEREQTQQTRYQAEIARQETYQVQAREDNRTERFEAFLATLASFVHGPRDTLTNLILANGAGWAAVYLILRHERRRKK